MDPRRRAFAEAARGFMPSGEGLALYEAAMAAPEGPFLEVGSYCGALGAVHRRGRRRAGRRAVRRGPPPRLGGEPTRLGVARARLVDPRSGLIDTLPHFRRNVFDAGLEDHVVAVVGDSPRLAALWGTPLAFLFIDGGHGAAAAHADYEGWIPHLAPGGVLAIHDVFPDPADGGRPPYEIYLRALDSGDFTEMGCTGSLRVLRRAG